MDTITSNSLVEAVSIITGGVNNLDGLSEHEKIKLMKSIFCTLKKNGTPFEVKEFAKMFNIDENEDCENGFVNTSDPDAVTEAMWVLDRTGKSVPNVDGEYDYSVVIDDETMVASEQEIWSLVENVVSEVENMVGSLRVRPQIINLESLEASNDELEVKIRAMSDAIGSSGLGISPILTLLSEIMTTLRNTTNHIDNVVADNISLYAVANKVDETNARYRASQYTQVKKYFSYIKTLQERIDNQEMTLISAVGNVKKKSLADHNRNIINNSNKELISFDDKKSFLDNDTDIYIFNDVDSVFVKLDNDSRQSKYQMVETIYRNSVAGFPSGRILFGADGRILPKYYIVDLFTRLEKNYDLDDGVFIVEEEMSYRLTPTAKSLNAYNIDVRTRTDAINDTQLNIYKDVVVSIPAVDSEYFAEYEANRIALEKENYLNGLIANANVVYDGVDWEAEYFDFKSNHLDDILSKSLPYVSLDGLQSLIAVNSIDISEGINSWLFTTFTNKVVDVMLGSQAHLIGDVVNIVKSKEIDVDGNVVYTETPFNIYEFLIDELHTKYGVTLTNQLYSNINNRFLSNNSGGVDVNTPEYSKCRSFSEYHGIFFDDISYRNILKNRIIDTNPNPSSEMDVKFIRIPYNSNDKEAAILNATNSDVYSFDEVVGRDPYWKASKQEVLDEDFNVVNSKYYSVENTISNYVNIHKVSHMLDYLVKLKISNPVTNSDTYRFNNSIINDKDVSVIDGVIGANVLLNRMMGVNTDTIYDDDDIKYIYGYNNETSTSYNIFNRSGNVSQFKNIVNGGTPTSKIVGDMSDIYVGQVLTTTVNGNGYTGIIRDISINYGNPDLSVANFHEYGSSNNNYNFTPAIMETSEHTDIKFTLTGIRVSGSVGFVTADYIDTILADYHAGSGSYNLTQDITEYKFQQYMRMKKDIEQLIPTITDPDIYASVVHFHRMQTESRYSRKLFEKSPGEYHDTYMEYLEDNIDYVQYIDWLNCKDVDGFDVMSDIEQTSIYKDKLIVLVESMIDYIDDSNMKGYLNSGEYQYYMKNMIRTVLMYFKSYTVDIMDVKTTYNINNPMDAHIKAMDQVKIVDQLRRDDVLNVYNDKFEAYKSFTDIV